MPSLGGHLTKRRKNMKKSNLLKKAVSVLLVASALAGCGQLCITDSYHSGSGSSWN